METDTVDLHAVRLDQLHDPLCGQRLCLGILQVVVVVKELGVRVDVGGELEGEWDESLADGVVPDARAVGAILIEG